MPLDQVSESAFPNLFIKEALLSFKVVPAIQVRHELSTLLDDPLELPQALRLLDLAHALPLHTLHLLADASEELLDEESGPLLD